MDEEARREDTWILKHGLYKCGSCGKAQPYIDISEMSHCYNCDHDMQWYETKDGRILPVRFKHNRENTVHTPMHFTY